MLKRIIAIAGIIAILALYIVALISAIIGNGLATKLFVAAIICTIAIPVMIHLLLMMNNARKGKSWLGETYSYKEKKDH
ncbi:MAG: hypothetical protein IJ815_04675 [Lachnospiraceae bacterium]|nr:hypothetical protein [Lachnospiraceae bacterium]